MALERLDRCRDDGSQVLDCASDPLVGIGHVGEETVGASLHHGEEQAVLRPEVVVQRAQRHAGLLDHTGDGRGLETFARHHTFGRVEHERAGPQATLVRPRDVFGFGSHVLSVPGSRLVISAPIVLL